ncbi:MIND complex subunit DSN1 KNAG_0H02790 [Huiozyma naganishii CBS 8797]|uniref:Uncharacterized protein n=1 Tax=Huiozyma naganishii (strain ATCC MYA-139 / BCRC 22969 / CBS 8797 / KCTC 17520 / NBRC 10181 / NCYC 3082 / Yp74L-3) TaxID=1071383 RepID=J7S8R1_HUIN7|nr:hypothetical protein KNAG_0H02790 [Kazachstania naganishii CBS 8797]CCK71694.1 hypothetical protein KNAG_0H02790 [Kazachstania naganishii CBS 8797]
MKERSRSSSVQSRRSHYSLKLETIPIDEPVKNKEGKNSLSGVESDEDFKFRRHKNKRINGVPSLGEKLDDLHNVVSPKRMENFDSSVKTGQLGSPLGAYSQPEKLTNSAQENRRTLSQPSHNLYLQHPAANQPYYGHIPTSPMNPQYFSQPIMPPNPSSMGPPYPIPQNYQSQPLPLSVPFLNMYPPSSANSYNYLRNRPDRKSMSEQRGRRLSIASQREDSIILPHDDVPVEQFYRHLAYASVEDRLKQLFTWCAKRSYDKISQQSDRTRAGAAYLDAKKITSEIIGEFVTDLQKGADDIAWEVPEREVPQNEIPGSTEDKEDTEIQELFDDDPTDQPGDNDTTYTFDGFRERKFLKKRKVERQKIRPRRRNLEIKTLLLNPKNVENEKNLKVLVEKVDKLQAELEEWKILLDEQEPAKEWEEFSIRSENERKRCEEEGVQVEVDTSILDDLKRDVENCLDRLSVHAHLFDSHSKMLLSTTVKKLNILKDELKRRQFFYEKPINSQLLLSELSKALIKR